MPAATPLNTNWASRQAQIDAARKQIEALRNREMPQGQMVGKWFVPPSWAEQLNSGLSPVIAALRGQALDKREQQLLQDQTADMQSWMRDRPQAGMDPETTPPPAVGEAQNITQPTQQEQLEWAQRGMTNPLSQALAKEMTKDIAISQPKEQRKRDFDYNQLTRRLEQADQHLALRLQDSQLNRDQRAALQNQRLAVQQQLAAARNAATIRAAEVGRSNININVGNPDIQNLEGTATQQDMILDAVGQLEDPESGNWATTGPGAWITGKVLGSTDGGQTLLRSLRNSDYNDAAQQLFYVVTDIEKGIGGTQFTPADRARVARFMPSNTDSREQLIQKGQGLARIIEQVNSRERTRVQNELPEGANVDIQPHVSVPPAGPRQPPAFNIQGFTDTVQGAEQAARNAGANVPNGNQPKIRRWNPQTRSFE